MKVTFYFTKGLQKAFVRNRPASFSAVSKKVLLIGILATSLFCSTSVAQKQTGLLSRYDSCRREARPNVFGIQALTASSPMVRLAYVIPSNRTAQPDGVADFQNAVRTGQQWFKEQMNQLGFGVKTFAVETEADGVTPLVHVVHVPETDDYLREDIWSRTQTAAINAGLSLWAPGQVWVIIPEAHLMSADGTVTGGMAGGASNGSGDNPGLAMIGSNALPLFHPGVMTDDTPYDGKILPALGPFPMKQDITFSWFEGTTLSSLASTWLGALWHEMGHAIAALPHDFRNDDNFHGNIMGNGLRGTRGSLFPEKYPQDYTRLEYSSALILNRSHYFNSDKIVTSAPVLSNQSTGSLTPENGHVKIAFQASDNDSLALAYLGYRGEIVAELVLHGTAVDTAFMIPYFIPGEVNPYDFSVYDKQGNRAFSGPLEFFVPAGYNQAPLPFIRIEPPIPALNQPVRLDASRSSDDQSISNVTAAWDVDNDGRYDTPLTNEKVTEYLYTSGGNYLIRLKLVDEAGAQTISTPVSIKIPGEQNVAIEQFVLIDAANDKAAGNLQNNMVIRSGAWEGKIFSVQANTSGGVVERLEFELTGPVSHKQTERVAPYSLFGDEPPGNYNGKKLLAGDYSLTATAYATSGQTSTLTVSFHVLESNVPGQTGVVFDKTIGGNADDFLFSAMKDADGGYLLGGYSSSNVSGDKHENSKGDVDYWIVKLDPYGNLEWDKTYGGTGADYLYGVAPTADGGYLLAGTSASDASGDKSENTRGGVDFWIIKVDNNGNKIWDKTLGGDEFEFLSSVIPGADGGYLLGGLSASNASGDKSEDSKGKRDYWIVRIDELGNKLWDKTYGGDDDDECTSIASTPDGYLISGRSLSNRSGDKSQNSNGFLDYWVIKIDKQGNSIWDRTVGGSDFDYLNSGIYASDGGYLLLGYSNSNASGDKSEDNTGQSDYWAVKIDSFGHIQWDKTFGGTNADEGVSAITTPDEGFLLAGDSFSDASGDKSENNYGFFDFWAVKIDKAGNKVWDKTIGGNSIEEFTCVNRASDGRYLLGGYSRSNASGDKTEDSKGLNDFWIVEVAEPTTPSGTTLTLINAYTEQDVKELRNGDVIPLSEVGRFLDVRANIAGGNVTQVDFDLKGPITHRQTERVAPYALFGDIQGNFNGRYLVPGAYTIAVTPYINGAKGVPLTISFTVTEGFAITSFTLIDATVDQPIGALAQGGVVDLSQMNGHKLAVVANAQPTTLDKVDLALQGPIIYASTERVYPYALFGDVTQNGLTDYTGAKMYPGTYTLTAIPYFGGIKGAAHTITFEVVTGSSVNAMARQTQVYPVPATNVVHIKHAGTVQTQVSVMDFNGKTLLQRPPGQASEEQLDVSALPKGIHYIKISSSDGVEIIRLVIE